jgi:hypothetical protein
MRHIHGACRVHESLRKHEVAPTAVILQASLDGFCRGVQINKQSFAELPYKYALYLFAEILNRISTVFD